MTGIHRDTIMRLGVRMGEGCQRTMDEKMRDLSCKLIQVDEVWGFVGMKQQTKRLRRAKGETGDVWTLDCVGRRNQTRADFRCWRSF